MPEELTRIAKAREAVHSLGIIILQTTEPLQRSKRRLTQRERDVVHLSEVLAFANTQLASAEALTRCAKALEGIESLMAQSAHQG